MVRERLSTAPVLAWAALLGMLTWMPAAVAQEALASLDRSTVFVGDTVVLSIEVSDPAVDAAPDYGALAGEFEILDTGTNARVEIINGQRRMQVTYVATLNPRRDGQIAIPALAVAGIRSNPLMLSVMPRPKDGRLPADRDVFIEVDAQPRNPYVHAQVRLTVRLYHAPPITEGALNPQQWPAGAVVELLGDDSTYQTQIGGQRYRVIERRYALFPESSGPLVVPPIRFRGRVADGRRGMNSLFSSGRLVTVDSKPIELEVRPQPASFSGRQWLPAASFEIAEAWPRGTPEFVVGEPLTRTLTTRAKGMLAAQLPEFSLGEIDGLKIYPDQPTSQTRTDGSWALAQRDERYALVPSREGSLTLPEIRIPWWDTEADRQQVAVIPAREIQVVAAAGGPPPAVLAEPGESIPTVGAPTSVSPREPWWREIAALMTLLWLLTLWLWWRGRTPAAAPAEKRDPEAPALREWRRRFERACRGDDPREAERALLGWASAASTAPVNSLAALAARLDDPPAALAVAELERCRYAPGEVAWRGGDLAAALRGGLRWRLAGRSSTPATVLPPLYPSHNTR